MKKKELNENTKLWTSTLDIVLSINDLDIPNFHKWVNWNGYTQRHTGFDFAAYLTKNGKCILGLPSEIPVRAIADGVVRQVSQGLAEGYEYATFINIEHGKKDGGMFSCYHHVNPLIKDEQFVKKGDMIATLYKDFGYEEGKLVHLHFGLTNARDVKKRNVDPVSIFPIIGKYKAEPQGTIDFQIQDMKKQPEICIANFKRLLVNNK